uniref:Uncharacterized protein n=1 Tax=viral metagenome TaxID=1070528 RepID=A0A6C0JUZ1_9ZZZZ
MSASVPSHNIKIVVPVPCCQPPAPTPVTPGMPSIGPFTGPTTASAQLNRVVLVDQSTGAVNVVFPSGVDGAMISVKSIPSGLFNGDQVALSTTGGQFIENPGLPSDPLVTTATFSGQIQREAYTWAFSGSTNTWYVVSDYEPPQAVVPPSPNHTITRDFVVADGYTVEVDDVISVQHPSSETEVTPGFTLPGSTSLPAALSDLSQYRILRAANIVFGFTNQYVVLAEVNASTSPTFGDPLYIEGVTANNEVIDGVAINTGLFVLLCRDKVLGSLYLIAFSTVDGTTNFTANPQSAIQNLDYTAPSMDVDPAFHRSTSNNYVIVAFVETATPNQVTMQPILPIDNPAPTPPGFTPAASQLVFTSSGSQDIIELELDPFPTRKSSLLVKNGDGLTQELLIVLLSGVTFTAYAPQPVAFSNPLEFGHLGGVIGSGGTLIVAERSNKYKTFSGATDLTLQVDEAPVFSIPGATVEYLQSSVYDSIFRPVITGIVNGTSSAICTGTRSDNFVMAWGPASYDLLPPVQNILYMNSSVALAAVYYEAQGRRVYGTAKYRIPYPALDVDSALLEGPFVSGIALTSGTGGETITATVFGVHEMSTAVVPGRLYYANTNGKISETIERGLRQFGAPVKLGQAVSGTAINFLLPAVQGPTFV